MTLVSIITPSFNQAPFLEQTILSVLDQDDCDIEHLVVDGGSTDGSVDMIRRYAHRLTWWVSEKDSGQAEAVNKGAARAHGEIIAWLNSDDTYLPGAVRAAVDVFKSHPDVVMVYGDMLAVEEHGYVINTLHYRPLSLEDLLCFQIIGQPAVFMRRDAFAKAGGLEPLRERSCMSMRLGQPHAIMPKLKIAPRRLSLAARLSAFWTGPRKIRILRLYWRE